MARLRFERSFERYLLDGERPIFAIHRHWAVLAIPLAWVLGLIGLLVIVFIKSAGAAQRALVPLVLIALGFAALHVLWEWVCWRLEWFILTDKRLLLTNGVIDRRTGAMPLAKVTDLTYHQPFVGDILRFGTFVLESAGQQQAMHDIDYVPHTPNYYRLITAAVHAMPPDERDAHLVLPGLPWWGRAQLVRTATRAELIASGQAAPDAPDDSRAIPIQPRPIPAKPTHRPASAGEVIFESEDIKARRRAADTSPIRYYPTDDPD